MTSHVPGSLGALGRDIAPQRSLSEIRCAYKLQQTGDMRLGTIIVFISSNVCDLSLRTAKITQCLFSVVILYQGD